MTLTVYIIVNAQPNLTHALSRWTISPIAGTHVGDLSDRVAHEIWDRISDIAAFTDLYACMIRPSPTAPQGLAILTCGKHRRTVIDIDGTLLIAIPPLTSEHGNPDNEPVT